VEVTHIETPSTEDEVKMTFWDSDIFKSPCLDDINFGFIKDLWEDLKGDFMRFLA